MLAAMIGIGGTRQEPFAGHGKRHDNPGPHPYGSDPKLVETGP